MTHIISSVLDYFVYWFTGVLFWAIIIQILLSWFNLGGSRPVFRLLLEITEPVLAPIRRVLPTFGMLDLSPMVALLLISFISKILYTFIAQLAPIS